MPSEAPRELGCEPGLLRHERLPFVSYPYEWPFEMLKDAALLQLGLLDEALAEGFVLKDGSPYNVQWRGSEPVFVDVGSFERLREGLDDYRRLLTLGRLVKEKAGAPAAKAGETLIADHLASFKLGQRDPGALLGEGGWQGFRARVDAAIEALRP